MNAHEVFAAVFDTANDFAEATAEYVQQYAENAMGVAVTPEVAAKIVAAKNAVDAANAENGEGQNNLWHHAEKPLSEIEIG